MYFVDDDTVQLENFKKGKFDVLLPPIQPEIFVKQMVGPEWGTKLIKVKAENKTPKGYSYVGFNLRSPKFKDVRVRKALNHLMNREWMIKTFFYEMYDRANGPVDIAGNDNDTTYAPYAFDVDKAKALLKAAGWEDKNKDGILEKMIDGKKEEMRFTILIATDTWQKWLTIYKEDAAKAGIEVNIQLVEWNSFLKLIDEAKFDAMAMAWGGGSPDMDFKQIWHSESAVKGGSNRINYSNSAVDKMIEEHRRILDSKTRQVLSHKIFRAIADDAPYIFMFSRKFDPYTHNARIQKPKDTFTYSIGKTYWSVAQ